MEKKKDLTIGNILKNQTTVEIKPGRKISDPITLSVEQGIGDDVVIATSNGRKTARKMIIQNPAILNKIATQEDIDKIYSFFLHRPIRMEIRVKREDIERLRYLCERYPKEWAEDLCLNVFTPAFVQLKNIKQKTTTLSNIKREASLLYLLFSEICDNARGQEPCFFKKVVQKVTAESKVWFFKTPRNAAGYAAYCIESYYGKKNLEAFGIKAFSQQSNGFYFKSFYSNYIMPDIDWAKKFLEDKKRDCLYKIMKVQYVKKKNANSVYLYNPYLSTRPDLIACDRHGKTLKPLPSREKNAIDKKVNAILYREIVKEEPYKSIFKHLALI